MRSNSIMITNLKKNKLPSISFRVTSQTALPIRPSKAGSAGTVSPVTLKGLDGNILLIMVAIR